MVRLTRAGVVGSPMVSMKAYSSLKGVVLQNGVARLENGVIIKVGEEFKFGETIEIGWNWELNKAGQVNRIGEEIEETEPIEESMCQNGDIYDVANYLEEAEREESR